MEDTTMCCTVLRRLVVDPNFIFPFLVAATHQQRAN